MTTKLTTEAIYFRVKISKLLDREGVVNDDGSLPGGRWVPDLVSPDGQVSIEAIKNFCGEGAERRILDFMKSGLQNDPWSRRTGEAQRRIPDGNGDHLIRHSRGSHGRRGPGRYSNR